MEEEENMNDQNIGYLLHMDISRACVKIAASTATSLVRFFLRSDLG